jgi:hypothetical protein
MSNSNQVEKARGGFFQASRMASSPVSEVLLPADAVGFAQPAEHFGVHFSRRLNAEWMWLRGESVSIFVKRGFSSRRARST